MADRIARSEPQAVHDLNMRETIVQEAMEWGSCYPHQGKEPEGCGDCARDVLHDEVKRLHAVEEVARKMAKALGLMRDKWENGTQCFEADEGGSIEDGSPVGDAFKLSDEDYNSILLLLSLPLVSELLKGQK